jgi:hypothetical protein
MNEPIDIKYLAGLIDGDGCIYFRQIVIVGQ